MSKTVKTSDQSETSRRAAAHASKARQSAQTGTPVSAIDASPRVTAQRQRTIDAFGPAAQRAEEEELLQGKFATAQRVEEEELLQGRFATVQRAEEEELLQGKFATAQRAEEEEPLQGRFATAQRVEEEEPMQAKENGQPRNDTGMPDSLKSGIESLSGMDMSDVNVHRNSGKAAELQAHAYAQGSDIHVAPGQEQHLPHEAWHVVQQRQGRVKPTMQMQGVAVNDDPGLETEADVMGAKAMQLADESKKRT